MAALDQGADLAGNPVFGIDPGCAHRDRRTRCAGPHCRRTRHHRRHDAGMALRIKPEFTAGPHRRISQAGQGLSDCWRPAQQRPTALVTIVLEGQVDALWVFDRIAHIAIGLATERGGVVEHGLPGRQRSQALVDTQAAPAGGIGIVLGAQIDLAKFIELAHQLPAPGVAVIFRSEIDAQLGTTLRIAQEFIDLIFVSAGAQAHPFTDAQINLARIAAIIIESADGLENLARDDASACGGQSGRLDPHPVAGSDLGLARIAQIVPEDRPVLRSDEVGDRHRQRRLADKVPRYRHAQRHRRCGLARHRNRHRDSTEVGIDQRAVFSRDADVARISRRTRGLQNEVLRVGLAIAVDHVEGQGPAAGDRWPALGACRDGHRGCRTVGNDRSPALSRDHDVACGRDQGRLVCQAQHPGIHIAAHYIARQAQTDRNRTRIALGTGGNRDGAGRYLGMHGGSTTGLELDIADRSDAGRTVNMG